MTERKENVNNLHRKRYGNKSWKDTGTQNPYSQYAQYIDPIKILSQTQKLDKIKRILVNNRNDCINTNNKTQEAK